MATRRQFLACSCFTFALGFVPRALRAQVAARGFAGLTTPVAFTQASFEAVLRTTFKLRLPSGETVYLFLQTVTPDPRNADQQSGSAAPANVPQVTSFTLKFSTGREAFPSGTYAVEHPNFGTFEMFVVPDTEGRSATAVFSQLVPAGPKISTPTVVRPGVGNGVLTAAPVAEATPVSRDDEVAPRMRPVVSRKMLLEQALEP